MRFSITIGLIGVLTMSACNKAQDSNINAPRPESDGERSTIWELFDGTDRDPNVSINVSKYLWNASLDALSFLPLNQVDPFSGLILTGYGRPAGATESYRVAVHITGPALDATNLRVAVQKANGTPASAETVRLIEDAILTRARQLRIAEAE